MGGGASITYSYEKVAFETETGQKHDLDPRELEPAWWSWAAWMRPDAAADANAAASMCSSNTGPSNCGEVAAFSVITSLGMTTNNKMGEGAVTVNTRYHGDDLAQYLAARSVAGCTADDLAEGVHQLSNDRITAKFLGLGPTSPESRNSPPEELACALALWVAAGAAPVATLNLQAIYDADAWHHQLVWGAGTPEPSGVLLANSVGAMSATRLKQALGTERILKIQRSDIEPRIASMESAEAQALFAEKRWKSLDVGGEIKKLQTNKNSDATVSIPASYVAGITLCAPKGSVCANAINEAAKKHSVGAPLPAPPVEAIAAAPLALLPIQLGIGCDVNANGVFQTICTDTDLLTELGVPTERVPALCEVLATEILAHPLEKEKMAKPKWMLDADKLLGNPVEPPVPAETVSSRARTSLGTASKEPWSDRLESSRAFAEINAWLHREGAAPLKRYIDVIVPQNEDDPYRNVMERKRMAHKLLCSFYSQATPQPALKLSEVLDAVGSAMLQSMQKAKAVKPEVIFVIANKVGREHHQVRSQAYPYDVRHLGGADGDVEQDLVVEARCKEEHGGDLLGFVNVRSNNYITDLAVAPAAQGMGLAASLIRAAAQECLVRLDLEKASQEPDEEAQKSETQPVIKLHVRQYNLQARALYLKLGFKETERCFPGWYDWHGGVSMEISIEKLLNPSAPAVPSKIPSLGFLKQNGQTKSFSQGSQLHTKTKPQVAFKGAPKSKVSPAKKKK
eukprot:gnl/MRDRNA2_/MRDRNA2_95771_c0_seq1.p1 gnl/MRDRNA2_/MRDRNA2_95771_c0~~gnl/MRDRNA2_/MRDRNA2_95771_c0_seq1.p1  ORF type:complete len:740 (+),score=152.33 gnl/MRDRNA2_/MRDRNA2_95771_c0_seq1:113-2332(+)